MTPAQEDHPIRGKHSVAAATLGGITDTTLADTTAQLGDWRGLEISFKRDDLVSIAFGDNKVRGLDLLVADAMAQSAEVLVTGAEVQS